MSAVAVIPVKPEPFPKNEPLNDPEYPPVALMDPVTIKLPDIIALPVYGNAVPVPPVEFIVTAPTPLTGDIEILVPGIICVTPPFNAYEAVVANDADNTCILEVWDVRTYEEVAAFNAIIDDSTVVILLLNPPLTEVKAPLISVAIWAELLNRVG